MLHSEMLFLWHFQAIKACHCKNLPWSQVAFPCISSKTVLPVPAAVDIMSWAPCKLSSLCKGGGVCSHQQSLKCYSRTSPTSLERSHCRFEASLSCFCTSASQVITLSLPPVEHWCSPNMPSGQGSLHQTLLLI